MAGTPVTISVTGQNPSVVSCNNNGRVPVFVTPLGVSKTNLQPKQLQVPARLPRSSGSATPGSQPLKKVLLKAVTKKGTKSDSKMFSLRNLNMATMKTTSELKNVIREGLQDEISPKDFDVGYVQGSNIIRICNRDDIAELSSLISKPASNVIIWCDGLRSNNKRQTQTDSEDDSDDESRRLRNKRRRSAKESDRDKEVQEYVKELNKKHGSTYTPMQYRIWAEMKAGGLHANLDDPPTTSMFSRAGGGNKTVTQSPIVKAVTDAATALTSVMTKPSDRSGTGGGSPAKLIENRSKLYRQLSDLRNLRDDGVLSDKEYQDEKEAIMGFLKQLNAKD